MARCGPDEVTVRDYWRSRPRRKPKKKAGRTYWTCHHGRQTCGVEHKSQSSALKHSIRLDREARRKGQRADWQPEKETA